jgi:type IV pilus assembly protein PilC
VFDRLVLRLPVVGKVVHGSGLFSMTTTAATLLKAGVPTIEALQLTEQALGNTILRERLADVTRRASEGTKLADAFEEQGGFPLILPQAIAIGELRGSLVDTLDGLAKFYEDVTESDLSAATEMIQPVVTLVVAGIVGFMAVALIQGIYSTLERVQ